MVKTEANKFFFFQAITRKILEELKQEELSIRSGEIFADAIEEAKLKTSGKGEQRLKSRNTGAKGKFRSFFDFLKKIYCINLMKCFRCRRRTKAKASFWKYDGRYRGF